MTTFCRPLRPIWSSRAALQSNFSAFSSDVSGCTASDLPPRDEGHAEIVVHEDDLLDGVAFAGPVLLGQADGFARAAPQDAAVFQAQLPSARAAVASRTTRLPTIPAAAGRQPCHERFISCLARFPALLASTFIVLDRHGMSSDTYRRTAKSYVERSLFRCLEYFRGTE